MTKKKTVAQLRIIRWFCTFLGEMYGIHTNSLAYTSTLPKSFETNNSFSWLFFFLFIFSYILWKIRKICLWRESFKPNIKKKNCEKFSMLIKQGKTNNFFFHLKFNKNFKCSHRNAVCLMGPTIILKETIGTYRVQSIDCNVMKFKKKAPSSYK